MAAQLVDPFAVGLRDTNGDGNQSVNFTQQLVCLLPLLRIQPRAQLPLLITL